MKSLNKKKKAKTENDFDWVNVHKDMSKEGLKLSFFADRQYSLAKDQYTSTAYDNYMALAITVRNRIVERWIHTQQSYHKKNVKRVYYLSMEFLIGRLLGNYIYNLGIEKELQAAFDELGFDLDLLREQEVDAALGNGGLGRLAACFLDSMATLDIPAHGYGIRYEYGIFNQKIKNGFQIELPDEWLRWGTPWEFPRPEYRQRIRFYGHIEQRPDEKGRMKSCWVKTDDVLAVPYDMPIVGYKNDVVNTLRLWSARSSDDFDLDYFNHGDYERAVYSKILSENISKVLYPNDAMSTGRELRLRQEYFFTAASIADIIRRFKVENDDLKDLPGKLTIQLNDTHPALSIVELMRVLVDDEKFEWETAWDVVRRTFAYTNHTLMPEALERWSVDLLEKVLPRHLQLIYEINSHFIKEIRARFPDDEEKIRNMSLVEESWPKQIRMAQLSIVGSRSVNGVSALHSDLLKRWMFRDFYTMYPEKFNNKTNGITQRRWLLKANPRLSSLITEAIGDKWVIDLDKIKKILPLSKEASFVEQWQKIKGQNKQDLATYIKRTMDIQVDPESMFDVQVKRIHEYKRQLLFSFYIISQYMLLKNDPKSFKQPRTFIVGGKAAPGYTMAKLIIKFVNAIGDIVNNDAQVSKKMKVIFLENYRVSLAEKIFPASELSEQISTAGTEASGTGNMKFMINGALTIGTMDGANVEMSQCLDNKDIFIFGLKDKEVEDLKKQGYHPMDYVNQSPVLQEIHHLLTSQFFCPQAAGLFDPIINTIFYSDPFLVCADFDAYYKMQGQVSETYTDKLLWTQKSINNVANTGFFSSDRTIREYADDIWHVRYRKV
ncbi:MAG: glycogen/starch/alpha-glucan phosphorylase [Candidatus Omnitrophica bacterium]|nr:glycogen/starch/alpha-glucan phosphorylase [Candidatus Omnitrophota bacterium]